MKKFKTLMVLPLLILLLVSMFGCAKKEKVELKILSPEGIPCVALGSLFDEENYTFDTVTGSDLLSSNLISGEYDVIVAPIIMGAQLYTKETSKYQLASILTLGNSYLVSKTSDAIESLTELEGQTVASYGKNTAPDIILKAALVASGVDLDKVTFVYENSVADVFTNRFMVTDPVKYILSAEPVISKMEIKKFNGDNSLTKINLQAVLKDELAVIPQAGIFVKKDLDKDVSDFLNMVKESTESLNSDANTYTEKLFNLVSEKKSIFESLTKEVIIKSIPGSNITYMKASDNKTVLDAYFEMISTYNANILGGKTVDEGFYY